MAERVSAVQSQSVPELLMRIFFICQRVPFPPERGDKITTFNEVRHLSTKHEVHVFCLADGRRDLDNISGVRRYAQSVTAVPVIGWTSKFRAFAAMFTGEPLSVAAFNEKGLHSAIKQKFVELRPDLVMVYSCNVAQYAEHFPQVPRIMQFAELDSSRWGQFARRTRPPLRWVYAVEQRRFFTYEQHIARTFSHALVCTAAEQRDFERLIPGVPVSLVGNGVDLDYFRSSGVAKHPGSIVFTGVMDYLPNVDAVAWFCDEVLPIVQKRFPEAGLTICGSRPAAAVRRLAKRPGVTVTGRVPDTRMYLDGAEVFVAPMRMARGIQNKLLEALAMGLPCVASKAAATGTAVPDGEGILVADDPMEFAEHIVHLLRDDAFRDAMAAKARAAAELNYRWEAQFGCLDRVVAALVPQCRAPVARERV
jgi:sugar transferase (PEP-CTERM/EpsH1 system associated)